MRVLIWCLAAICAICAAIGTAAMGRHAWELSGRLSEGSLLVEAVLWMGLAAPWLALFGLVALALQKRPNAWVLAGTAFLSIGLGTLAGIAAAWTGLTVVFGVDGAALTGVETFMVYGSWAGAVSPLTALAGSLASLVPLVRAGKTAS